MHPIRSSAAVLATLALALVALSPGVIAQEEGAEHPLVGAWIVTIDVESDGQPDTSQLAAIDADGTFVAVAAQGAVVGAWQPTGERSADITFHALTGGPAGGLVTIRVSLEVAEDGQTFSATFTQELPAGMGAPEGQLGPGSATGQRISVEPMGEPAAPIPPFGEQQPPGGETPSEPEASPAG